jgi:hypothetical protein
MATQNILLGSQTTLLSTELNSLASSSTFAAGAISSVGGTSGLFNNVYGGGGLGGWPYGRYTLKLGAPAGSLTAGTAAYVYFIRYDGTNVQDGSASITPANPVDLPLAVRAVSTAQIIEWDGYLPPGDWYVYLTQNTGQTWASSGNTLLVIPYTYQYQ